MYFVLKALLEDYDESVLHQHVYIYECHHGTGYWMSDSYVNDGDLYCDVCGDEDRLVEEGEWIDLFINHTKELMNDYKDYQDL